MLPIDGEAKEVHVKSLAFPTLKIRSSGMVFWKRTAMLNVLLSLGWEGSLTLLAFP